MDRDSTRNSNFNLTGDRDSDLSSDRDLSGDDFPGDFTDLRNIFDVLLGLSGGTDLSGLTHNLLGGVRDGTADEAGGGNTIVPSTT